MSRIPYVDAGKFDKMQESFNAIHQALMILSLPNVTAENRKKEVAAAIKGVSSLGQQVIGTLKEIDRRLHELESRGL